MKEKTPNEIMDEAINHGLTDFYVAYSGGKDSGIVLDYITKEFPENFRGVIFVDTGIATKATVDFVTDYCKKHGGGKRCEGSACSIYEQLEKSHARYKGSNNKYYSWRNT